MSERVMAEVQWYYARNDQQFGPVAAGELKQMADAGQLAPDDLLWREGMDAWTTAINLRGLFNADGSVADSKVSATISVPAAAATSRTTTQAPTLPARAASLARVLRTTQILLWLTCVLVIFTGAILFARRFLAAADPTEEAMAGAVFAAFSIGAYVLARAGEKLSRLLLAISLRRRG